VNLNKQFGLKNDIPETFLLIMISFFTTINGAIRVVFGLAMDKLYFRVIYSIINIIIIVVSSSIYFIAEYKIIYFIYNILSAMCLGGHFSCFAAYMPKKFGIK